jgi:predicted amidophosphoribosyltransferase
MSPSSSIRDFAQYAGRFLWPRNTADLIDTTVCPACRTPLTSAVCSTCGLDLRHPAARNLLTASTDAATS